jgi:protein TonB
VRGLRVRAAQERLTAPGLAGSAALHLLVVATFLVAGGARGRPALPPVYRVSLVAAPGRPAEAATPAATPAPTPARPTPDTPRPTPAVSRAPAVPLKPAAAPPRTAPAPAATTANTLHPAPTQPASSPPATIPGSPSGVPGGSDAATIKTEGVEFPFPGYLRNLVAQVYTRWRPAPSSVLLEAEVFFFVHRDGSVTGLQFIRRSGSFAFDLEAQGAIEAASRAAAFGALPSGYGPDLLPVSFFFNPRSVR